MKACLCCGADNASFLPTCRDCGEASFAPAVLPITDARLAEMRARVVQIEPVAPVVIDDNTEPAEAPETPNNAAPLLDPPTLVDAPKGRRSARRS